MLNTPFDTYSPAKAETTLAVPVTAGQLPGSMPASLKGKGVKQVRIQVRGSADAAISFRTTFAEDGTGATPSTGQSVPFRGTFLVLASEFARFTAAVESGAPSLWVVWE